MTIHAVDLGRTRTTSSTGRADAPSGPRCIGPCTFHDRAPWHHDQLVTVTDAVENAIELLDLAVTWGELDYSGEQLVGPSEWPAFLAAHHWRDRALAVRLFGLAEDIAARSAVASWHETATACI